MQNRPKFSFRWCFYLYSMAVLLFQEPLTKIQAAQSSPCESNKTTSIVYILNDESHDEVTLRAVMRFVRMTFSRMNNNNTEQSQAAVALILRSFDRRIACVGMPYNPNGTLEEDIERLNLNNFDIDCTKAYNESNMEAMKSVLLNTNGTVDSDRFVLFTINLTPPMSFFKVSNPEDVQAYRIFTHPRYWKQRQPPGFFDEYMKNKRNLTVKNSMYYTDARAFGRSLENLVPDICGDDPGVAFRLMVSTTDDTFFRLRFNDTRERVTWARAKDTCARRGMTLLAPRTNTEAKRFVKKLAAIVAQNGTEISFQKRKAVNIFIGLRRNKTSKGRRFEWTEGSNYLFYAKWAKHQPRGITECAYWQFKLDSQGKLEEVGWHSCGCGEVVESVSICQTRLYALRQQMKIPENDTAMDDTVLYSKGNFIKVKVDGNQTTIMSLSLAVSSGRLQRLFFEKKDIEIGGLVSDRQEMFRIGTREKEALMAALPPLFHRCTSGRWSYGSGRDRSGVSMAEVCDGRRQCGSRSDERLCGFHGYANCTSRYYTCNSRQCVPLQYKCDLIADCADGSDEEDCEDSECKHRQCSDGTCLPKPWFGDGQDDCEDNYDSTIVKADCVFACERTKCISEPMLKDESRDCNGPEGPLDVTLKPAGVVECGLKNRRVSPRCVMVRDALGEVIGCRNLRHLMGCKSFQCPEGYIKCPGSYCIPQAYMGDGRDDCLRGEDEHNIQRPDVSRNFLCHEDSVQSVPILSLCDGKADCAGGEDELDCGYPSIPGFLSLAGALAVFDIHGNGQQSQETRNADFLQEIDGRTRYLDLSGTNVSDFFLTYPEGKLTHLLTLNLSNTGIDNVFRHARDIYSLCEYHFRIRDLNAVMVFNVSHNNITELPYCSHYRLMKGLKQLDFSYNAKLKNVTRESFSELPSVKELDLSFTGLSELSSDVFEGLTSLETLSLRGLQLQSFNAVVPETVKFLNLELIKVEHLNSAIFKNITEMKEMKVSTFVYCCPRVHGDLNGTHIAPHSCHHPPDPFSSCTELIDDKNKRAVMWTITSLAIFGNLATLLYRVTWDRDTLKIPSGLFITNLCFSDLLMGVYFILIKLANQAFSGDYVLHQKWWRYSILCKCTGLLANVACLTATWFVVLLTLDQIQIIKYPKSKIKFTFTTAIIAVAWSWLFTLAAIIPPLLPWARGWEVFAANGMCLALGLDGDRVTGWLYPTTLFVLINGALYTFTALGQFSIYSLSRSTGRRFRRKMRHEKDEAVDARLLELSMARRFSRITMTNFLCFFMITVMGALAWQGDIIDTQLYAWTMIIVFPINSAINPMIYFYPVLSKKLDEFQLKHKRTKPAPPSATETSDTKQSTQITAITGTTSGGEDGDSSEDEDFPLPEDDEELIQQCCEDLDMLQDILEGDSEDDSDDSEDEEITREDMEMLESELKEMEIKLAEAMNINEEKACKTENTEDVDTEEKAETENTKTLEQLDNAEKMENTDKLESVDNVGFVGDIEPVDNAEMT